MGCDYAMNPPDDGVRRLLESRAAKLFASLVRVVRDVETVEVTFAAKEWDEFEKAAIELRDFR